MYIKGDIKRKWQNPFKQDQSPLISSAQNYNANTMRGRVGKESPIWKA